MKWHLVSLDQLGISILGYDYIDHRAVTTAGRSFFYIGSNGIQICFINII